MNDCHWLYNAPTAPGCVAWSQDNLLALVAAHTVVIAHPGDLSGPKGYVAISSADVTALDTGCLPEDSATNLHLNLAVATESRSKDVLYKTLIKSISWSPVGCSADGGCLLATVTNDYKVRLFAAPRGRCSSQWVEEADVTELLKNHLKQTNYKDADTLWDASEDTAVLRLRGGGGEGLGVKRKRQGEDSQQRENGTAKGPRSAASQPQHKADNPAKKSKTAPAGNPVRPHEYKGAEGGSERPPVTPNGGASAGKGSIQAQSNAKKDTIDSKGRSSKPGTNATHGGGADNSKDKQNAAGGSGSSKGKPASLLNENVGKAKLIAASLDDSDSDSDLEEMSLAALTKIMDPATKKLKVEAAPAGAADKSLHSKGGDPTQTQPRASNKMDRQPQSTQLKTKQASVGAGQKLAAPERDATVKKGAEQPGVNGKPRAASAPAAKGGVTPTGRSPTAGGGSAGGTASGGQLEKDSALMSKSPSTMKDAAKGGNRPPSSGISITPAPSSGAASKTSGPTSPTSGQNLPPSLGSPTHGSGAPVSAGKKLTNGTGMGSRAVGESTKAHKEQSTVDGSLASGAVPQKTPAQTNRLGSLSRGAHPSFGSAKAGTKPDGKPPQHSERKAADKSKSVKTTQRPSEQEHNSMHTNGKPPRPSMKDEEQRKRAKKTLGQDVTHDADGKKQGKKTDGLSGKNDGRRKPAVKTQQSKSQKETQGRERVGRSEQDVDHDVQQTERSIVSEEDARDAQELQRADIVPVENGEKQARIVPEPSEEEEDEDGVRKKRAKLTQNVLVHEAVCKTPAESMSESSDEDVVADVELKKQSKKACGVPRTKAQGNKKLSDVQQGSDKGVRQKARSRKAPSAEDNTVARRRRSNKTQEEAEDDPELEVEHRKADSKPAQLRKQRAPKQSKGERAGSHAGKQSRQPRLSSTSRQGSKQLQVHKSADSAFSVGQSVEVNNDEEVLAGAWFKAQILELQHSFALVEYHDLVVSEHDASRLREWFPLPNCADRGGAALGEQEHTVHTEGDFKIRPEPPKQFQCMAESLLEVSGGDEVEAYTDGAWWPCALLDYNKEVRKAKVSLLDREIEVEPELVRPRATWLPEVCRWTLQGKPAAAESAEPDAHGADSEYDIEGGDASSESEPESESDSDSGTLVRRRRALTSAAALKRSAAYQARQATLASGTRSKALQERDVEPYVVPADFDVQTFQRLVPDLQSLHPNSMKKYGPHAIQQRFLQLRAAVPPEEIPKYEKGEHLKDSDALFFAQVRAEFLHVYQEKMQAQGLTEAQLVTLAKSAVRRNCICSFSPYARTDTSVPRLYKPKARDGELLMLEGSNKTTTPKPKPKSKSKPKSEARPAPASREQMSRSSSMDVTALPRPRLEDAAGIDSLLSGPGYSTSVADQPNAGPCLKLDLTVAKRKYRVKQWESSPLAVLQTNVIVPPAVYERRLLLQCITSLSWCNTCLLYPSTDERAQQGMRCAVLATGTKLGKVVYWSCTTPCTTSPSGSVISWHGCQSLHTGHVTALAWAVVPAHDTIVCPQPSVSRSGDDWVLLASAGSQGDIRLWGGSAGDLMAGKALCMLGELKSKDDLCVFDLSFQVLPSPLSADRAQESHDASEHPLRTTSGGTHESPEMNGTRGGSGMRLMVAGAKAVGTVFAWQSGEFDSVSDLRQAVAAGSACLKQQLHSTGVVTAVSIDPWSRMVISTGYDGSCKTQFMRDGELWDAGCDLHRLNPSWEFAPSAPKSNLSRLHQLPIFGMAHSSNHLVVAVARSFNISDFEATKVKCSWDRVAMASIHLMTLYGSSSQSKGKAAGRGVRPVTSKTSGAGAPSVALPLNNLSAPSQGPANGDNTTAPMEVDVNAGAPMVGDAAADMEADAEAAKAPVPGANASSECGDTEGADVVPSLSVVLQQLLHWLPHNPIIPASLWDLHTATTCCGFTKLDVPEPSDADIDAMPELQPDVSAPPSIAEELANDAEEGGEGLEPDFVLPSHMDELLRRHKQYMVKLRRKVKVQRLQRCQRVLAEQCLRIDMLQDMVAQLRRRFTQDASESARLSKEEEGGVLAAARGEAWRGLQLAIALLHLGKVLLQDCAAKACPQPVDEVLMQHILEQGQIPQKIQQLATLVEELEVEVIQMHVQSCLASGVELSLGYRPAAESSKASNGWRPNGHWPTAIKPNLSKLLMADWVSMNVSSPEIHAMELLPVVADVYADAGESPPDMQDHVPAREEVKGFEGPVALSTGLLSSARDVTAVVDGVTVALPRCAATMVVGASELSWHCAACKRKYAVPPWRGVDQEWLTAPKCLYCGMRLRTAGATSFLLLPPAVGVAITPAALQTSTS